MIDPDDNNKVPDENHLMINTYLTDFFMTVIPIKLAGTGNGNNTITDISHHRIAVRNHSADGVFLLFLAE